MEVFDLTLPFRPDMPVHPGDPEVRFTRFCTHEEDGYQVTQYCLGSHSGTHLDAPRHLFADGATLDRYEVERFVGPGVVVDCRTAPDAAMASRVVEASVLAERLALHPVPRDGFVLLWTEGALLTVDAARCLLEMGPGVVGTDGPSLDAAPYPVHHLLLGHGVLLAENLQGLDRLGPGPVTCAFLPLAATDADGAPVRAIAWR